MPTVLNPLFTILFEKEVKLAENMLNVQHSIKKEENTQQSLLSVKMITVLFSSVKVLCEEEDDPEDTRATQCGNSAA